MDETYNYYQDIVGSVDQVIDLIANLDQSQIFDVNFLEHTLIPAIGLNNEALEEQPPELAHFFGKGLHLWQYPSQFARYLVWLAHNAKDITSYCEIGCRWGGTFIVVNEWLKKAGAPIAFSLAIDPIAATPFIKRYIQLSKTPVHYLQNMSTAPDVVDYLASAKPQMVFIDGDHSIGGVMFDHLLVRKSAKIIVHHDVFSQACPGTSLFWNYLRQAETGFEPTQFIQQYDSVNGNYLGIGVLKAI